MTTCLEIAALKGAVEVVVDRWGIPHVYAASDDDLYLAQGFVTAQFRLWQMDLWRKRGLGLLAASHGERFVAADRARRLFLYRGDMRREWAAYMPGVRDRVEAFVAGVNAYVIRVLNDPELMPPEFEWTCDRPGLWEAADIVRIRSVGLRSNVVDEAARAQLMQLGALDQDTVRRATRPSVEFSWPRDLDPADVPSTALSTYRLAMADVDFAAPDTPRIATDDMLSAASNVWAIGGARTATGRPLLANDPHRAHGVPSVRWLIHLCSPSISAIGAVDPVHPGIGSGHNGHIGFGYTYSACDQEDLVVYPSDGRQFSRAGQAQRFTVIKESVEVRDAPARQIELKYTDAGPVIHEDAGRGQCIAVRSAFLEPGGAPYFAGVAYHRATSMQEFQSSLDSAVAPTMNYCAAEPAGNVGLFVRGAVPRRRYSTGALPTMAQAAPVWEGFHPADDLPTHIESPQGWVGNCNQVPESLRVPISDLGNSFSDDTRYRRLSALIESVGRPSLDDCARFQCDQVVTYAVELIARLLDIDVWLPPPLRVVLMQWSGELCLTSPAAAFFTVWFENHVKPTFAQHRGPDAWRLFRHADLLDSLTECPDTLLAAAARAAYVELVERQGTDCRWWRLEGLQNVTLRHPLEGFVPQASRYRIGPASVGGSVSSLNKAAYTKPFDVDFGPSFRILVDVGEWQNSRAINMPGQSGDPRDSHWCDMFEPWRQGQYVPLLWRRADVEEYSANRWTLVPAGGIRP